MNDFTRTQHALDRSRLDAVVNPIVRAHGGEIVDIEWKSEGSGWVLRIFVEKLGSEAAGATTEQAAVDLQLCANVARDVSPALDVADIIPHRYHLEVSSPGVERTLRGPKDYDRFVGKKAKIRVREPVNGQKVIVGVLEKAEPGYVSLRDGGELRTVSLDVISSGRLVFEFGPAPRPGKARPVSSPQAGAPQVSPPQAGPRAVSTPKAQQSGRKQSDSR